MNRVDKKSKRKTITRKTIKNNNKAGYTATPLGWDNFVQKSRFEVGGGRLEA